MSIYLKIKSKHLALEPAIIRKEEQKLKKQIEWYKTKHQLSTVDMFTYYKEHPDLYNMCLRRGSLIAHRSWNVRNEARATYLARAYLKGMPYKVIEPNVREKLWAPVMDSLIRMVMKYGRTNYRNDYERTDKGMKVVKTAEAKAKEDVLKWLEQ